MKARYQPKIKSDTCPITLLLGVGCAGALTEVDKSPPAHADCCGVAGFDADAGIPGVFRNADIEGASRIGVPTAGVFAPEWKGV